MERLHNREAPQDLFGPRAAVDCFVRFPLYLVISIPASEFAINLCDFRFNLIDITLQLELGNPLLYLLPPSSVLH